MLPLLCLVALSADLTPRQAAGQLGKSVSVRLTVLSTGENAEGFLEAYSEKAWNVPGCFFLRVPKAGSAALLKKLGVSSMEELKGATVRVKGKVEQLNFGASGKYAAVVARSPAQLEVLSRPKPAYTATKDYTVRRVSGFELLVHPDVVRDKKEHEAAIKELRRQLDEMPKYLPADKLARLKRVRIWMEHRQKGAKSAAAFHPSRGWLLGNGYNPDKAGCVEISNTRFFVEWAGAQPYMVMHEMAHAYHNLVLGASHAGIRAAYKQAMERKLYEKVKHVNGGTQKAYATTNDQEYFAELTEAYFGKNDFFPFNRAELQKHDPAGYALMRKTWGDK